MVDSKVVHPKHYGGDTPYETIKVIEAWDLNFNLGNAVKYISRAGKKNPAKYLEDIEKAIWYLQREFKARHVEKFIESLSDEGEIYNKLKEANRTRKELDKGTDPFEVYRQEQLANYPDLDQFTQYNNAATDDIMAVMYDIIDEGKYNPPMPQQALQYGIGLFQQVWLKMKHQKLEEDRLEMLMRWVEDANGLLQKAMMQPPIGDPTAQVTNTQPGQPQTQAMSPPAIPGAGQPLPPGQNTQSSPMVNQ